MSIRQRLRALPVAGSFGAATLRHLRPVAWRMARQAMPHFLSAVDLQRHLPTHIPNSQVLGAQLDDIILRSAEESPRLLRDLAASLALEPARFVSTAEFAVAHAALDDDLDALGGLLAHYGSDKSTTHDYHLVYGAILRRDQRLRILEIGLGSNAPDVPSTMGPGGRPGASLRAFREFAPSATLHGVDVDPRALFEEERITTGVIDATDDDALEGLFAQFPQGFDLVIDDGLHALQENLRVLTHALRHAKVGGWVVIEDIGHEKHAVWDLVGRLLPDDRFSGWLVRTRACLLFAVQRTA